MASKLLLLLLLAPYRPHLSTFVLDPYTHTALDIIIKADGTKVDCAVVNTSRSYIDYREDRTTKSIAINNISFIIMEDFPAAFNDVLNLISEGKYTNAQASIKELLNALESKKLDDPNNIMGPQLAYLNLLCTVKEGNYMNNNELQKTILEQINTTYLAKYKDSFILYKILSLLFELYKNIDDLDSYIGIINSHEPLFKPDIYDPLYYRIIDLHISEEKYEKALELLNSRVFSDKFIPNLKKLMILFSYEDSPLKTDKIKDILSIMDVSADNKKKRFVTSLYESKLAFKTGNVKECAGKLSKQIAFFSPAEITEEAHAIEALLLLASSYEKLAEKSDNKGAKIRYLSMGSTTLRELLEYYPSVSNRAEIIKRLTDLEKSMETVR